MPTILKIFRMADHTTIITVMTEIITLYAYILYGFMALVFYASVIFAVVAFVFLLILDLRRKE